MVALVFLLFGFVPILGWLTGMTLMLISQAWSWRQKLLGILVWPGGLVTQLWLMLELWWWNFTALGLLVVTQLAVASYLYRAAGQQASAS